MDTVIISLLDDWPSSAPYPLAERLIRPAFEGARPLRTIAGILTLAGVIRDKALCFSGE
jgi:hypothetical protein